MRRYVTNKAINKGKYKTYKPQPVSKLLYSQQE